MEAIVQQLEDALRAYDLHHLNNQPKPKTPLASTSRWDRPNIPYEVIAPFMTHGNLASIARQKTSRRLLVKLSRNMLRMEDRFLFWEDILSSLDILPAEWRAEIWLDCANSSETWNPRERNGHLPCYDFRNYDRNELSNYVVSSKWLVDAPLVRKWYCRLHKPGYEPLSCIDQKRTVDYPLRSRLLECIREDDLPSFAIMVTLSDQIPRWSLVRDLLDNHATAIFSWLVENDTAMIARLNPFYLMVYAAANLSSATAIAIIKCLEEKFPRTLASRDAFGNSLLWYCLHNKSILWFSANSRLVSFLCECGCCRDSRNHLGLSLDDISKAMTTGQKQKATKRAHILSKPEGWDDAPMTPAGATSAP